MVGALLPLRGLITAAILTTATTAALWVAIDGAGGGYEGDGDYLIAVLGLAKYLAAGLVLGHLTGHAWRLLTRWHVVEVHARGLVQQIRAGLDDVNRAAATLAERLDPASVSQELRVLRARLARGVALPGDHADVPVSDVLQSISGRWDAGTWGPRLTVHADAPTRSALLSPVAAHTLGSVIERQLANVTRHAPQASTVQVRLTLTPGGALHIEVEDDGGGRTPTQTGLGTAWSVRQLHRIGGTLAYYDAASGTGLRVTIPIGGRPASTALPVREGIDRFAFGMVAVLRWSSYVGDTLIAQAMPGLGSRWLLMPLGACLIELAIQRGIPGVATSRQARQLLASALAVALTAAFTLPAGSPPELVPASTSVVVLSQLLLARPARRVAGVRARAGGGRDAARRTHRRQPHRDRGDLPRGVQPARLRAAPLPRSRAGPRRHRARRPRPHRAGRCRRPRPHPPPRRRERAAARGHGRSAGEGSRRRPRCRRAPPRRRRDRRGLPSEVVRSGLEAAVAVPILLEGDAPQRAKLGAVVDRITLAELAALAADERASCAPPGLLGRRRLRALHLRWETTDAGAAEIRLRAEPTLRAPDRRSAQALEEVADHLGLVVQPTADDLRLAGVAP